MKREHSLPSPGVQFGHDYKVRLGALIARTRASSQRSEGMGRWLMAGAGSDFVGFKRYRPGQDLRLLDWSLYLRMRKPFVRVTRREANQTWAILLDTSASMGIGEPGKLQAAAELAGALSSLAIEAGAQVQLHCSSSLESVLLSRAQGMRQALSFLEQRRARGAGGLGDLVRHRGRFRGVGSLYFIGDLLDIEPPDLLRAARRGRELHTLQILAPQECRAPRSGAVLWVDPESDDELALQLNRENLNSYEFQMNHQVDAWKRACLKHRACFGSWSSATPFEQVLREAARS